MNVKYSITLICFVFLIKNALTERYKLCLDVVCPSIINDKLNCPPDSKPIIIDPKILNNLLYGSTLTDDDTPTNHHLRFPRFASKTRDLCCPYKQCKCNECIVPECDSKNHTAIVKKPHENKPGACCPKYECGEKPDCKTKENGYTWHEHCTRCECHDKEFFCYDTCPGEQNPTLCLEGLKEYMHGEHWQRDACTDCSCNNGQAKCRAQLCLRPSCHKTIQLPDNCCPDCDITNSSFCAGMEHCGIACKYDYLKSVDGCSLCECAPNDTSTVKITTTLPSTTTELPSNIFSIDKNKTDDTNKQDSLFNIFYIMLFVLVGIIILALFLYGIHKRSQKQKDKKKKYDPIDQINPNSSFNNIIK